MIIINLIKTRSIWTQVQFVVFGSWSMAITIWFVRRWNWNIPGEIDKSNDSKWKNLFSCMLTHCPVVMPYYINFILISSLWILLHFVSVSAFHQSFAREMYLIFHLSGINRLINIRNWMHRSFSQILWYILTRLAVNITVKKIDI